jgi:galactose mutarotase-like enzyme
MPKFQDQDVIEITRGASRLLFAPQAGGRLLSWHLDGASVIHWPEVADWSRPAAVRGGNPLLFPFLARHRVNGEIGWWKDAGGVVRAMPLHGFARDLPFTAQVSPQGDVVSMTLVDSEATRAGYPFGFRFEAAYRLVDEATLDVDLTTTNTGTSRLPYYAGHHFYFTLPHAKRNESTLTLPHTLARHQLADGSITEPVEGLPRYTFDDPQIHDRFHCLDREPDAPVRIDIPALQRAIEIDLRRPGSVPWYAVTSWTEKPESDFYCVEPWLGLPDAIHNGLGLRWVEPGETETASLRINVSTSR